LLKRASRQQSDFSHYAKAATGSPAQPRRPAATGNTDSNRPDEKHFAAKWSTLSDGTTKQNSCAARTEHGERQTEQHAGGARARREWALVTLFGLSGVEIHMIDSSQIYRGQVRPPKIALPPHVQQSNCSFTTAPARMVIRKSNSVRWARSPCSASTNKIRFSVSLFTSSSKELNKMFFLSRGR
jgi:hypothetical protein